MNGTFGEVLKGAGKVALVACAALVTIPAHATYPDPLQPAVGKIKTMEAHLDKRLTADYNKGLLDSLELAQLRRDLDVIRNDEEERRLDPHGGMSPADRQHILGKLYEFNSRISSHEVGRAGKLATTSRHRMH